MRYAKFGIAIFCLLLFCCSRPAQVPPKAAVAETTQPQATAVDTFQPVKTMLARTCAPCHNPGGKMYERMPFDQPVVVKEHKDGIHSRLSAEDKAILEAWLKE